MRYIFVIILTIGASLVSHAESVLDGTWQGVIIRAGHSIEKGTLFYTEFNTSGSSMTGNTREEIFDTQKFAVKKIDGTVDGNTITFRQFVVVKSTKTARMKWCRFSGELTYNEETGYLEGTYKSTDCKRVMGKIILYRADFELSKEEKAEVSHIWFENFVKDYKEGLNAPEIRAIERANFKFEPIYFDFDKYEIREEHHAFLDKLIKVVKGHSDLRVRVVGHTDSDGSNSYNDSLSRNRAQAIIEYFVRNGLSEDRLEFDFKGETQPADSNSTSEGKQRNRRVDFSFI